MSCLEVENGAPPGVFPTAAQVQYTPSDPVAWTPVPANVRAALDDLAARGVAMRWGNTNVGSSTTTRFMLPSFAQAQAPTDVVEVLFPRAATARRIVVLHNNGSGNGNTIDYTLMVGGVATALTVGLASTSAAVTSFSADVAVALNARLSMRVSKALGIGSSPDDPVVYVLFT